MDVGVEELRGLRGDIINLTNAVSEDSVAKN
jgi:hypothetical protein